MKNTNKEKNQLKVLLLEDSTMDAELIVEHLRENFNPKICIDIVIKQEAFIEAISKKTYDLILADFTLPGFDGFAALDHAKSICPNTPFICVSGYIGEEVAVELLKRGATDYVSKDKLGRLIFAIERALKETRESIEKEKRTNELVLANKELALQNKEILYINHHDYLTNLYNRIYFEEEKKHLDAARQLPISVIIGDINGLKLVNDGFGHCKGDEVLVTISKILKDCCREKDIVARIGGDEFGILLPKTDSKSVKLVCACVSDACKDYVLDGTSICPSISLGHGTKYTEAENMDNVCMVAEESMSKHKLLESKSAHSSIIASIKAIMFEKSQETEEHAERIIQLSKAMGVALSLSDDQLNELELLSTLHDIGKMGIGVDILSKPGKLSNKEWVEMRKHPEVGYRIAQATSELFPIANYILCHHERWDGKGYPQGLIGEKIPLLSRIVAIADSFDAMTNDRAYRAAMTSGEAIEEIRKNSGTQFDPKISKLFLNILSKENKEMYHYARK